ncbi:MAG: Nre family DNA repair protein [Infirmifilum sp.]
MSSRIAGLCLKCRGAKNLCGLPSCPFFKLWRSVGLSKITTASVIEAPSPPSIFVGRIGYPKVRIAPSVTTLDGDASVYDLPEKWLQYSIEDVLNFRLSLVMGNITVDVRKPDLIGEIALLSASSKPVDLQVKFAKPPSGFRIDPFSPPFGPSGTAEKIKVLDNPRIPRPLERLLGGDTPRAQEAIWSLYESGLPVSTIQRVFSAGLIGRERKIVPTRWSITAVDDIISQRIVKEVKKYPSINTFLFFERRYSNNLFIGILAPASWSFEWIEAWFPHTTWNPGAKVEVEADWEGYTGRKEYATLGGCYYSARLGAAEFLRKLKRQATVLLIREIYEGFFLPIGVWFVRENIRELFKSEPERYDTVKEVLERLGKTTRLPLQVWLDKSRVLKDLTAQKKLEVKGF